MPPISPFSDFFFQYLALSEKKSHLPVYLVFIRCLFQLEWKLLEVRALIHLIAVVFSVPRSVIQTLAKIMNLHNNPMIWIIGIIFQVRKLQLGELNSPAQARPMSKRSPRSV